MSVLGRVNVKVQIGRADAMTGYYNLDSDEPTLLLGREFMVHERATLARASELIFNLYLYSGLRPLVRGKITSKNGNLRNLSYTKI